MFTALAHPLRRQILRRMLKEKGEVSPRELAADLSQPLSALSYHETGARLDPALLPCRD